MMLKIAEDDEEIENLKSQQRHNFKNPKDYEDIGILIDMGNEEEDMSIVEDVKRTVK